MEPLTPPVALTVAGSDSGGGAGIQADLKTFDAFDVHGASVLAALTAQNSLGVQGFEAVAPAFVRAQLDSVASDLAVRATKTGMLADAEVIAAVADGVEAHDLDTLVVDPVAASKHGDPLLADRALDALRERIVPLALVATPNLGEVALLTGVEVTDRAGLSRAASAMLELGCRWVLVKGGHLSGDDAVDLLTDGHVVEELVAPRSPTPHTHGTGCTLSAAIAAGLARGADVVPAVRAGKDYLSGALERGVKVGAGIGPVDHRWRQRAT